MTMPAVAVIPDWHPWKKRWSIRAKRTRRHGPKLVQVWTRPGQVSVTLANGRGTWSTDIQLDRDETLGLIAALADGLVEAGRS